MPNFGILFAVDGRVRRVAADPLENDQSFEVSGIEDLNSDSNGHCTKSNLANFSEGTFFSLIFSAGQQWR